MLASQVKGVFMALARDTLRYKTVLVQLPIVALIPAYFALVFGLGQEALLNVLAGAVVSAGVWVSIGLLHDAVYEREVYKYLEMLIASPARPLAYLAAHLAFAYIFTVAPTLPLLALYTILTSNPAALLAIPLLALLSTPLSALALQAGLKLRNIREASGLPSLISIILVFLPPVYYPAQSLPYPLSHLSLLIPSAALAEAYRALTLGNAIVDPVAPIAYLAALTLASIAYVAAALDWRIE